MDDMSQETVVRTSLDDALHDRLRAVVENPTEPCVASCTRSDAVLDHRMASHRRLTWTLAEAEALKRRLKAALHGGALVAVGEAHGARSLDLGEPTL